jgi:FkbM family methyltransferase
MSESVAGTAPEKAQPTFASQFGEDRYLWELFGRRREGFYVDIGAADGIGLSNTYFFEQMGWRGVCVEPHPQRYLECVRARPRSRVVHAAVSRRGSWGLANFTVVVGAPDLSFLTTNAAHVARARIEGQGLVPVPVPLADMEAILAPYDGPIDFVSLDVEGAELDVLHGFDLQRRRPAAWVIEDNSFGHDLRVEDYMARHGYLRGARLGCNDIFLRQ